MARFDDDDRDLALMGKARCERCGRRPAERSVLSRVYYVAAICAGCVNEWHDLLRPGSGLGDLAGRIDEITWRLNRDKTVAREDVPDLLITAATTGGELAGHAEAFVAGGRTATEALAERARVLAHDIASTPGGVCLGCGVERAVEHDAGCAVLGLFNLASSLRAASQ